MKRFDLEKAIAMWRHMHSRRRAFLQEDIDELERHLRDHAANLVAKGEPDEAAFQQAVRNVRKHKLNASINVLGLSVGIACCLLIGLYVQRREGASVEAVRAKLPEFVQRNYGEGLKDPPRSYALELEPLVEVYHGPAGRRQPLHAGPMGSRGNLYLFSWVFCARIRSGSRIGSSWWWILGAIRACGRRLRPSSTSWKLFRQLSRRR